jgi:hypothetical protein
VIARIEAGGHDDRANVHIVATGKDEAVFGRLRRSPVFHQAPVERPVRSTNRYPWVAYQSIICGRAARVAVGDGVVAVGRARADGVPVLVGAGGLVDMLKAAGIPEQALRTSADASVTYQEGPIRTERA